MKGSANCVFDFVKSVNVINDVNHLLRETNATISADDVWMPNKTTKKEDELKIFLRNNFSPALATANIEWWLKTNVRTPNWDLISTCTINDKKGILLVEAKAHVGELKKEEKGKTFDEGKASIPSKENHIRIAEAIGEANAGISKKFEGVKLSRDKCYQLSNRIANAWWLANKGIPVVLMYLGFEECTDIYSGRYKLFKTNEEWQTCFKEHAQQIGADVLIDKTIDCGESSFTIICRSLKS